MGMVKKMEGWGTRTSEYSKVNVVWYEFENEDDARDAESSCPVNAIGLD